MAKTIAQLEQENAELQLRLKAALSGAAISINRSGGVYVAGAGNLFATQWLAALDKAEQIRAFIVDHKDQLDWSGGKGAAKVPAKSNGSSVIETEIARLQAIASVTK